jgi:hypothetical protein
MPIRRRPNLSIQPLHKVVFPPNNNANRGTCQRVEMLPLSVGAMRLDRGLGWRFWEAVIEQLLVFGWGGPMQGARSFDPQA